MKYAVTAEEMKRCDTNTIEKIGISSEVLMERAALAVEEELKKKGTDRKRVLVAAGCGNNGGDGIALGRLLLLAGIRTEVYLAGEREKCTAETAHQLEIFENLGFSLKSKTDLAEYDMIVDALFGIGLSREISGTYKDLVEWINMQKEKGTFVCSVDIPSGICADTGKVMGCAIKADLTVTFAFAKRGQLLYPGKAYTGELVVRDIGIHEQAFFGVYPGAGYFERSDLKRYLPERKPDGNKGTFGKVLVIAGSKDMCGACLLCARAVLKTGAGMVKIITPECNREIVQQMLPEVMLYTYEKEAEKEKVSEACKWADAIVIGPGLSKASTACGLLRDVLTGAEKPVVIDADALNLIADNQEIGRLAAAFGKRKTAPMIFTPHPGELIRLAHTGMEEYRKDKVKVLRHVADTYGALLAGKDAVTITVLREGKMLMLNTSGNDGMATAGSGDVLSGIIAGLLAQKTDAETAVAFGVYLHGIAGEEAAHRKGRYGMLSGDIADVLGDLLREIEGASSGF